MTTTARASGISAAKPALFLPVLDDLGIQAARVRTLGMEPAPPRPDGAFALVVEAAEKDPAARASEIVAAARAHDAEHGALILFLHGDRDDGALARLRDGLWPTWHVVALYAASQSGITRRALDGERELGHGVGSRGVVVVARTRTAVMAPDATVAKFDQNAAGWNGTPGAPGWRHHRWMRRFVGTFASAPGAKRILDFGCGAGWVGIEAALRAKSAAGEPFLAAFDPSPAMVESFGANARAAGLTRCEGRTGFGEAPPFPAAGEEPFDLVISSGVISFSPERERWIDGLVGTLAPRATLVVGDVQRDSLGMKRRRAEKPLLPVREMNAATHTEIRSALEARGLTFVKGCGYQRTRPFPQLLHLDATKLKGVFEGLLVGANERAARTDLAQNGAHPERFDSWVMELRR